MASPDAPCLCGHPREAHEHFRPGKDCGQCGPRVCPKFAGSSGVLGWIRARFSNRVAPAVPQQRKSSTARDDAA